MIATEKLTREQLQDRLENLIRECKLEPELILLAKISEPEWATPIRKRNEALEEKLWLLSPFIGEPCRQIPLEIVHRVAESLPWGCPHCQNSKGCGTCAWSEVRSPREDSEKDESEVCSDQPFFGGSMEDLRNCTRFHVIYGSACCRIFLHGGSSRILSLGAWERNMLFVRGHIAWSNLDCWGKEL